MTFSSSTSSASMRRARSRRAAPHGARLALCLAFVVALAAARPAEAFKWRWWKWKAMATHHSKSSDDTSMKHTGHMKHTGGKWSGDDSECDDCGTWWRARQWREGSWWGKHCRRDDGWKPGTGLRAGKCMVHQCGWQLKKCRWDMTCREAVQCAIGAWARDIPGRPLTHRHLHVSRLSRNDRETCGSKAFSRHTRKRLLGTRNETRNEHSRFSSFAFWTSKTLTFFFSFRYPIRSGCGMGGDAESRACAFQCALDNRNDVTEALFSCVLDKNCMPEM